MRCPWTRYQDHMTHVAVNRIQTIIEIHAKRNAPRAPNVPPNGLCSGHVYSLPLSTTPCALCLGNICPHTLAPECLARRCAWTLPSLAFNPLCAILGEHLSPRVGPQVLGEKMCMDLTKPRILCEATQLTAMSCVRPQPSRTFFRQLACCLTTRPTS